MLHASRHVLHSTRRARALAWIERVRHRIARALLRRRRRAAAYRDLELLDAVALRDLGLSHRAAAEASHGNDDAWQGCAMPVAPHGDCA